jgi:hypothetical protein
MRRHNTNPSKVLSGGRILDVVDDALEHVDVGAVPLADSPSVAILAGNPTDLSRLMIMVDREPPIAGG